MKLLNSVRGFVENLWNLLRYGNMRNLEGFFGGFFLVYAVARAAVLVSRGSVVTQGGIPVLICLFMLYAAGLMLIGGAVYDSLRYRKWGCRFGLVSLCALSIASLLSAQPLPERLASLAIALYYVASLCWLYWRMLNEPSLTKEAVHHGELGELTRTDSHDDSRRSGRGWGDLEISRIPAGAEKGR